MILRGGGRMTNYLQFYSHPLATLFPMEPARVQSLISHFERPEVRAWLQLSLAQQVLGQMVSGRIVTLGRSSSLEIR